MKVALVTGASSGIGRATARELAVAGFTVFGGARESSTVRCGADVIPLELDVTSEESVTKAVEAMDATYGQIDTLVCSAGIATAGTVEATPLHEFERMIDTNLLGTIRCIQATLPLMRRRHCGHIVCISSIAGRVAFPASGAYSASKFAVEAVCRSLAQEVAEYGIKVAVVEPSVVRTPLLYKRTSNTRNTHHERRLFSFFQSLLQDSSATATEVAATILRIVTQGGPAFLHPVGPRAQEILDWAASMTDDDWIGLATGTDAEWRASMAAAGFSTAVGLDVNEKIDKETR